MIRLSLILKKCANSNKFEKEFIRYIASLDFKEFEKLFNNYTFIINKCIIKLNNPKFFSKNWIKSKILNHKFYQLYYIFYKANYDFVKMSNKNLKDKNDKKQKLIDNIYDIQRSLIFLNKKQITLNLDIESTNEEIIDIIILISDSIYIEDELYKMINELISI